MSNLRDKWDDCYCNECQEFGHPTPGTDEWDEFQKWSDEQLEVDDE